jgi:hypothetical protein
MARVPKKSARTAPPMDRLIKPAVGVAIAMLGYYIMKGSELYKSCILWSGEGAFPVPPSLLLF